MKTCNMKRCAWVPVNDQVYKNYHDNEWGVPVIDEHKICEMFFLETFQAGLSWITILKKREAFRKAFDDFDPNKIAKYDEQKIQELLLNPGIIRCQRKIRAAVKNAAVILSIRKEKGSFSEYLWSFSNHQRIVNMDNQSKTTSELSDRISADLKKRGMSFVGSITMYSYLQAIGIINDHHTECFRYKEIEDGVLGSIR
ncbi:MAG: DNA-3-methyladenine glycosylase I [Erysipelotrichaceae bacterium]|nr:DNA-3-methyladenine glycosylase I [Erysipelotrichaceae bacterium]